LRREAADVKKSPTVTETGIYRRETYEFQAHEEEEIRQAYLENRKLIDKRYNLEELLTDAKKLIQYIRDLYKNHPPGTASAPSNLEEQYGDAFRLLNYTNLIYKALEAGDTPKAALYGYWVGRFYEKLCVRQVEHVALVEREQMKNRKAGGQAKAIKPEVKMPGKQRQTKYGKSHGLAFRPIQTITSLKKLKNTLQALPIKVYREQYEKRLKIPSCKFSWQASPFANPPLLRCLLEVPRVLGGTGNESTHSEGRCRSARGVGTYCDPPC